MSNHLDPDILKHFEEHNLSMIDMSNDMRKLQNNFEIHFQNQIRYAEELLRISKKVDNLCDNFNELKTQVTPVIENFSGLNWSRRALMWTLVFLGAIGSLALMIKKLLQ